MRVGITAIMEEYDGNSSEGILCSSDDEIIDGLSEAVEHHIFEQEKAIRHPSADPHPAYQEHPMFTPLPFADGLLREPPTGPLVHSWGQEHGMDLGRPKDPPPPYYFRSREPPPLVRDYTRPKPYGNPYGDVVPPAPRPSSYLSTPRAEMMAQKRTRRRSPSRPNPARLRREYSPPHTTPVPHKEPKQPAPQPASNLIAERQNEFPKRPYRTRAASAHIEKEPSPIRHPRVQTRSSMNNKNTASRSRSHEEPSTKSQNKEMEEKEIPPKPAEESNNDTAKEKQEVLSEKEKPEPSLKKPLPKPIAFKIKSNPPPQIKKHHPLDPFFSPGVAVERPRSESPERWSHDKFAQSNEQEAALPDPEPKMAEEEPSANKDKTKRGSSKEAHKKKKKESSKKEKKFASKTGHHAADDKKHKKKNKSEGKGKEKKGSGHGMAHQSEEEKAIVPTVEPTPETILVQEKSSMETEYEEEIIEEIVEEDDDFPLDKDMVMCTDGKDTHDFDVEDDDELLNLRLNALASALEAEANAEDSIANGGHNSSEHASKKTSKSKAKSRGSKSSSSASSSLRKVSLRSKKVFKRGHKREERKSNVLNVFLKKYSDIKRYHSPERDKHKLEKRAAKPDPTELTLFGEIIKNKTKSTSEALRYIRSLPDGCKKTEMFLKLMKVEDPTSRKRTVRIKTVKEAKPDEDTEQVDRFEDNYDEIEMELEDENDDGICPPGTSDEPVVLPSEDDRHVIRTKTGRNTEDDKPSRLVSGLSTPKISNPATPSQETIWSMLEHPSLEGSSAMSADVTADRSKNIPTGQVAMTPAGRRKSRNASDELDIDENDLLLLRATLLKQLEKRLDSAPGEKSPDLSKIDAAPKEVKAIVKNMALLPSQYPYQPPTLHVHSVNDTSKAEVQTGKKAAAPAPSEIPADKMEIPPSVTTGSNPLPSTPTLSKFLHPPQMSSTPYQLVNGKLTPKLPPAPAPAPTKKKRHRMSRSQRRKKKAAAAKTASEKPTQAEKTVTKPASVTVQSPTGARDAKAKQAPADAQPQVTQSPASAKDEGKKPTPVRLQPLPSKQKVQPPTVAKNAEVKPAPGNIQPKVSQPKSTVVKPAKVGLVGVKPREVKSAVVVNPKKKPPVSNSQVIFRTKTTLIKTNNRAPKRSSPISASATESKRKVRVLQFPASNKPSMIPLPRHRPVVINLQGSSDEEESDTSPSEDHPPGGDAPAPSSRPKHTKENPQDLRSVMLNSLIEQVRQQTSLKQPDKQRRGNQSHRPRSHSPRSREESWPFSPSSPKSSPGGHRTRSIRNLSHSPGSGSSTNLVPRVLRLSQPEERSANRAKVFRELKETKIKFLKLKGLISKDEMKHKRILKIKDVKQAELKTLQDELKEMIHRVAAIKGKAARCEDVVARYQAQETKMKERIEKRNKLKLKLKEQIKNQMIKSITNEKDVKTVDASNGTRPKNAKPLQPDTAEFRVSPLKERNQEKLQLEKRRLLAVEQKLAAEIKGMKKSDGGPAGSVASKRRVSLSKEVQSQLDRYKKSKKLNKPSSHDLSLSKIAISSLSPVRKPQSRGQSPAHQISPVKKPQTTSPMRLNQTKTEKKEPVIAQGPSPVKAILLPEKEIEAEPEKVVDKEPAVHTKLEPSSDENDKERLQKMQENLSKSIGDVKGLLDSLEKEASTTVHCDKYWEKSPPDCFKSWKFDLHEIFQKPKEESPEQKLVEFAPYSSPLRLFRSHRLSPFLRTKEKVMIKSRTYSHKINPERMLCRYDLTGTCNDPNCKAQHSKDYVLTRSELTLDLISYCPTLLGRRVEENVKYEDLLKLADNACERLCGLGNKKTTMPIDDMAILIASQVNTALGNKAPFTTIFKPRMMRLKQNLRSSVQSSVLPQEVLEPGHADENDFSDEDVANSGETPPHPDQSVKEEDRYFPEKEAKSLRQIENALKRNPNDIQLWLQLSNRKMQLGSPNKQNSLELALHTMCLALEENPYVGELWANYLGLLRKRKGAESDQDLDEMVSQAIELVPLSRPVWNQLLSWDCGYERRALLYDQLISNLLKNVENDNELRTDLNYATASRWLLQMVLQRTQLLLLASGVTSALQVLEVTVKDFSQQCRNVSGFVSLGTTRCLTQRDLCNMWLAYINVKYFDCLPSCFLTDSSALEGSRDHLGVVVVPNTDVVLQLDPKKKMEDMLYLSLLTDINIATKECSSGISDVSCMVLLYERLHLETTQERSDDAIGTCQILLKTLKDSLSTDNFKLLSWTKEELQKYLTDVELIWADILARREETLEATQVFDMSVTERPWDAKLCYEASLFQLNQEAEDVEAALLYYETCASAFLDLEEDTLDIPQLRRLFHYLLRLPVPLDEKCPPLKPGMTWDHVRENKTHLWLIYSSLLKLGDEPVMKILQAYENAIVDVADEKNRQEIWLRYLGYRLSLAPTAVSNPQTKSVVLKARKTWLRNFTNVVRRCLQISATELPSDGIMTISMRYTDHSFHNKVADVFLSCFHTRQQISAAYSRLTSMMPHNVPFLLRACRHFLSFGDHASVVSVLWKATSSPSCQSRILWKISVASHYARGKITKSIRLCRRALGALPYSRELWADYLTLLRVHGKTEEYQSEKARCQSCLQTNPEMLLHELTPS